MGIQGYAEEGGGVTEDEAISMLKALPAHDEEAAHSKADEILCNFLRANGHAELANTFDAVRERIGFWYA